MPDGPSANAAVRASSVAHDRNPKVSRKSHPSNENRLAVAKVSPVLPARVSAVASLAKGDVKRYPAGTSAAEGFCPRTNRKKFVHFIPAMR